MPTRLSGLRWAPKEPASSTRSTCAGASRSTLHEVPEGLVIDHLVRSGGRVHHGATTMVESSENSSAYGAEVVSTTEEEDVLVKPGRRILGVVALLHSPQKRAGSQKPLGGEPL